MPLSTRMASSSGISTPPRPLAPTQSPTTVPLATGRTAEAGRSRILRRDKDNFSAFHERSKKHITNGPFRLRPPTKISTKTIDTDTIGRVNKGMSLALCSTHFCSLPVPQTQLTMFSFVLFLTSQSENVPIPLQSRKRTVCWPIPRERPRSAYRSSSRLCAQGY